MLLVFYLLAAVASLQLNVSVLQCAINTFSSYSSCCCPHYVTITTFYNPLSMSLSPGNMGNDDCFTTLYRTCWASFLFFLNQLFLVLCSMFDKSMWCVFGQPNPVYKSCKSKSDLRDFLHGMCFVGCVCMHLYTHTVPRLCPAHFCVPPLSAAALIFQWWVLWNTWWHCGI